MRAEPFDRFMPQVSAVVDAGQHRVGGDHPVDLLRPRLIVLKPADGAGINAGELRDGLGFLARAFARFLQGARQPVPHGAAVLEVVVAAVIVVHRCVGPSVIRSLRCANANSAVRFTQGNFEGGLTR